jgi:beta-glucanase (GH16 family)
MKFFNENMGSLPGGWFAAWLIPLLPGNVSKLKTVVWLAVALSAACGSARAEAPAGYQLAWSDDFNGTALDTNRWFYRTGERLLSFQKPENISVTNGLLRVALKHEDAGKVHYTAGGVISRDAFKYGYFEARFRCPQSAGWHTAFWLMKYFNTGNQTNGVDFAQQVERGSGAVKAQEIDICEQDSVNNLSYSAGVIDWSGQNGKTEEGFGRKYFRSPREFVPNFSSDFHVWGCEFTPTVVKFFLDGKLTHQTDATKFPHGEQNVWLTCVGVLWGDPVKPQQIDDHNLPAYAEFDWVRVYTKP